MCSLGVTTANVGSVTTYRRASAETIFDVSFSRLNPDKYLKNWMVSEEFSVSDHQYITFNIRNSENSTAAEEQEQEETSSMAVGWAFRKLNIPSLETIPPL